MKKPDYSDLDAAESLGHIFGVALPVVAILALIGVVVFSVFF